MENSYSKSNSVSDFLRLEPCSINDDETCDSLIAQFQDCKVEEGSNSSLNNKIEEGPKFAGSHLQPMKSKNNDSSKNRFEKNRTLEYGDEHFLTNKQTSNKQVVEIGVNRDESSDYKVRNNRKSHSKYAKRLNQCCNFKQKYLIPNCVSRKQYEGLRKCNLYKEFYRFYDPWQFNKQQWHKERMMKKLCFLPSNEML